MITINAYAAVSQLAIYGGGPGSGRHKEANYPAPPPRSKQDKARDEKAYDRLFDRGKRFQVMVSNPSHNNGKAFGHQSFDSRKEAEGHAQKMMGDLPHLSTHVKDRGSSQAARNFFGEPGIEAGFGSHFGGRGHIARRPAPINRPMHAPHADTSRGGLFDSRGNPFRQET